MAAKKWFPIALTLMLVSACGANPANNTALPGDGTLPDDGSLGALSSPDPYGLGSDPYGSDPTLPSSPLPNVSPSPVIPEGGFTLKGIVTDSIGTPLSGAKVSIGAQTALTSSSGTFEITKIMDTQISVEVSLSGYQSITAYTIGFTETNPTADKEFKLANAGSSTGGSDSGSGSTDNSTAGFTLEASFSPKTFKSVSSMVVEGDIAYVLGIVDNLIFDRNTVVGFNATSGEEIVSFSKTGLLSWLPNAASSLALIDGQLQVSDGSTTWFFATDGSLLKKSSGARSTLVTEATDEDRNITYKLKGGAKIEVRTNSAITTFSLPDASSAKSLGLNNAGELLVLDTSKRAVLQYTFKP